MAKYNLLYKALKFLHSWLTQTATPAKTSNWSLNYKTSKVKCFEIGTII